MPMPLYDGAIDKLRENLTKLSLGERVSITPIGELTDAQFQQINDFRKEQNLPDLESKEVIYLGRHHYNSRTSDGYTVDDIIEQIISAMSDSSELLRTVKGTVLENKNQRDDGYGNMVNDRAVLELTSRKPRSELYSVIPRGDVNKPPKSK